MDALTQLRVASQSIMDIRAQMSAALGSIFGGARDFYQSFGWNKNLSLDHYRFRFERDPLAARVVEAFPQATWRGHGELVESEDPNEITEFEKAWFELSDRLKIWQVFKRADVLCGLGHYSTILIGAPGNTDEELPKPLKPEDIYFLQPYSEKDLSIKDIVKDITSSRFGLPLTYTLSKDRTGTSALTVHWTRVNHIVENPLDDNIKSEPRLKRVMNDLDDLYKIKGGGSEAFWMRAHQGYIFNINPDALGPKAAEILKDEKIRQEFKIEADQFAHNQKRMLNTYGMDVKVLGSDTAGFDTEVDTVLKLISAGSQIPMRILVGSERGELASTQDRENWIERVTDRRLETAEPVFVRQFIGRLIEYQAIPEPEEYAVRWPVKDRNPEENAKLADMMASANQKAGETIFTPDEIRDQTFAFPPLDDLIDEADEQPEEPVAAARWKQRRTVYLTALDKRRHWWRTRASRQRKTVIVSVA